MKYIRTKDGIFDITGKIIKDTYYGLKQNEIYIGCDYKQADTIEELCDEFVIKPGFSEPFLHDDNKQSFKQVKQRAIELGCFKIYGAIWTDKGLIYVAKINEKGELRLL